MDLARVIAVSLVAAALAGCRPASAGSAPPPATPATNPVPFVTPDAGPVPCAVDGDCVARGCMCRCELFRGPTAPNCNPGHCAADPCRFQEAHCDPAAHRCALRPRSGP